MLTRFKICIIFRELIAGVLIAVCALLLLPEESHADKKLTIAIDPSGGGTVSANNLTFPPETSSLLDNNAEVSITATPGQGYIFDHWSLDDVADNDFIGDTTSASTTIRMSNGERNLTAYFTRISYVITATAGTGGSISPSGNVTVNYGGTQVFSISADSGYEIDTVTVDGGEIDLSGTTYTFSNVNANHTITVTFRTTGGDDGDDDGEEGSSDIPGCAASTFTSYSNGFNAADFNMINTGVSDSKIFLQTGAQAINPNSIVIPFEQSVGVTFMYELAGHTKNDFGWMLASEGVGGVKNEVYQNVNDNDNNGLLDNWNTTDRNGDGVLNALDNRVVLGKFAGGTELVFYLKVDDKSYTCFTKDSWNIDVFNGNCSTASFSKEFELGSTSRGFTNCGPSQWLEDDAVNRLGNPPFNLNFGTTTKTIAITRGQIFPHVMVGSPDDKPNEWILGWEDLNGGGDYDLNDMVFRIDRRTGGMAQLESSQAISPSDSDAYFTAVSFEVYDNMPCNGQTGIKYYVSIDNGANWVEIMDWDFVKTFSGSGDSKKIGNDVTNWTPGNPALTYRLRRVDFSGSALVGNKLIWKAEMFSEDETCVPEIIDVVLTGSVATHGFFSRASPSVQTNILYSGSYETPAIDWTEKVLRGHLYATRLYDPADPYGNTHTAETVWDAGVQLTAMSPANRTIYYPNIAISTVTDEVIGTGDGTNTHFTGTLAHHPVSATTLTITDQYETVHDRGTDILEGDYGGGGTINRYTGAFDFNFDSPPVSGMPVLASYTYYTTSSTLSQFTTANVSNDMLGLDDTFVIPDGYLYDLNGDDAFDESDGDWLVGRLRGYANGTSVKKEWLLGQIDHSVPAVQTPPGRPAWYFGTAVTDDEREAFDTFVHKYWERPTVAYVGARDGMLHAFDAGEFRWGYMEDHDTDDTTDDTFVWGDNPATIGDNMVEYRGYFNWTGDTSDTADYGTGDELWAFIPTNLIPRLKNNLLTGEDQAYVDASPAISDVYVNGGWKTVLFCAEGNGGDTVFCLDVTTPTAPTFMWEFSDPDLFRSRSSPAVAVVGKVAVGGVKNWAAFFVSGKTYDNTLYPSIYMIDISKGSVIQRIFLDSEANGVGGVPSGQPAVVDSDGNGYIDRIYIGTDKGYLYKVIMPDDPTNTSSYGVTECVINTDFTDNYENTVASNQRYHPIYASPAVVVQNGYSSSGEIEYNIKILFGTGDSPYYDENINTNDTTYHFFAYVDEATKGVCNTSTVTLDWMYELPAGQRIFASAFAAAGAIYFGTSTSETEDPCEGAGDPASNAGQLYVMDINPSGDTVTPDVVLDTGNILSPPVVDDEHLYVKTIGGGLMATPGPYNNPVIMGGLVETGVRTWQEIFGKDEALTD